MRAKVSLRGQLPARSDSTTPLRRVSISAEYLLYWQRAIAACDAWKYRTDTRENEGGMAIIVYLNFIHSTAREACMPDPRID